MLTDIDLCCVSDTVFFEIEMGGKPMGRITLGLFGEVAPKTVANFVALANGFDEQNKGFKGTIFHRRDPLIVSRRRSL